MAVRFDASTDRLTGGGITGTVGTVAVWFRVAVDRNAFSNAWVLWNSGTTGVEAGWGTDAGGTSFVAFDSAFSTQTGPDVSVGTWYCMALVMNGTSWTLYYGTDPADLTVVGPDTRAALSSPGGISVSDPTDWLNGDIASLKVWARALSAQDVEDELSTYEVVNSTSLVRQHRFTTSPGTTNEAGSGGNLTAGSTATATSTGPAALDVTEGALAGAAPRATGALAAVETDAAALAGATALAVAALAAVETDAAALAGSAPLAVAALTAIQGITGALAGASPVPVGALAAVETAAAALAGASPVPVGALTGDVETAQFSAALAALSPRATGALAAVEIASAALAGTSPRAVGTLATLAPTVFPVRAGTATLVPQRRAGTATLWLP